MDLGKLVGEAEEKIKFTYHQMNGQTVAHALSMFLAGAGGMSVKELPKNIVCQDFLDSLINHKVGVTGEFGLPKLASMLSSMLLQLFVKQIGLPRTEALCVIAQVMAVALEQVQKFAHADEPIKEPAK